MLTSALKAAASAQCSVLFCSVFARSYLSPLSHSADRQLLFFSFFFSFFLIVLVPLCHCKLLVPYLTLHNNNNNNNNSNTICPSTENFITEEVNVDVNIVCLTV